MAVWEPRSLQGRLLTMILGLMVVIWLSAACFTWYDASHEVDELLDGHLAQVASLLVAQQAANDGDEDDVLLDTPVLHKYAPKAAFQVFRHGRLIAHTVNAGTQPMSTHVAGFETIKLEKGGAWRVFAAEDAKHEVKILVGEEMATRHDILWAVLRSLLMPLMFALPLLAFVGWWAVRKGLAPLRQLSAGLALRSPQSLQPVVLADDTPTEIQPLIQALNALFNRIEHMVVAERRFTADAAHELRTPIAAIRAQAQVALGAGLHTDQREHALNATVAGCDRATRLVQQLLTLARLESTPASSTSPVLAEKLDVSAVARRVAADLAPAALAQHQHLELDASQACIVTGNDLLVGVLLRNLIDNAIRYSPQGARIVVNVGAVSGKTVVSVQDSGPGMTQADMDRLGERFFRVLGNEQPGSGLGWSIVRRISDVSGAQLSLKRSASLGGLDVTVEWPARS
jgi:two-component system, OmpR family, sensor histidine kinase QseC